MLNQKIILFTLTTLACSALAIDLAQAATFNFSGFSISDGTNSYEAEGSFDLANGFLGDFDLDTPNLASTLSVSVTTISGTPADFSFNASNINFGSSTFSGNVTGNIATLETISLVTNGLPVILGDSAGQQNYANFTLGLSLNTVLPGISGNSFNDAITTTSEPIPEPLTILGSLVALGFGTFLKSKKNLLKR